MDETTLLRWLWLFAVILICTGPAPTSGENSTVQEKQRKVDDVEENIGQRTLIVGTLQEDPYFRIVKGFKYEGFIPDLISALSRRLHFNYRFRLISPTVYGSFDNKTSKWNGLIGEVIKSQVNDGQVGSNESGVDIGAAGISITPARQQVVDFVRPFQDLGLSIIVQRQPINPVTKGQDVMSVFQPMDLSLVVTTVVLMVLVWVVIWIMNSYNPHDYGCRYKLGLADKTQAEMFNLSGSFWFVFSTLQWQGYERAPRSVASKFLGCIWFSYVTIFVTTYIAGVVNSLFWYSLTELDTAERPPLFDLMHLMMTQTGYKVGTVANSQTYRYITDVAAGLEFRALRNQWLEEEGKSLLVPNLTAGLYKVRHEKYAFIVETMVAKLHTNRRPCDLVTVGESFGRRSYGLALPKGSPLLKDFDNAIQELIEDGTLEDLERRWFTDRGECWNVTAMERGRTRRERSRLYGSRPKQLGPNSFWGPLFLVIIGVCVTCAIAGGEIVYHRYKCKYAGTSNNAPLQGQHIRLDPDEGNM